MPRVRFNPDESERKYIFDSYENGIETSKSLATRFSVTGNTIIKFLRDNGKVVKSKGRPRRSPEVSKAKKSARTTTSTDTVEQAVRWEES